MAEPRLLFLSLALLAILILVPVEANFENSDMTACGDNLVALVSHVCVNVWDRRCGPVCKRRRKAEGLMAFEEQRAKAFLARRSRGRGLNLAEECCQEGCRMEEVREHC